MPSPIVLVALAVGLPVAWAGVWSLTLLLRAKLSGWARLAERYATTESWTGDVVSYAEMGQTHYKGVLSVRARDRRLFLSIDSKLHQLGHRSLAVPTERVRALGRTKGLVAGDYETFEVDGVRLALLDGDAARLRIELAG